jgi:hypothetical protein
MPRGDRDSSAYILHKYEMHNGSYNADKDDTGNKLPRRRFITPCAEENDR